MTVPALVTDPVSKAMLGTGAGHRGTAHDRGGEVVCSSRPIAVGAVLVGGRPGASGGDVVARGRRASRMRRRDRDRDCCEDDGDNCMVMQFRIETQDEYPQSARCLQDFDAIFVIRIEIPRGGLGEIAGRRSTPKNGQMPRG
jgi:hypothetical protein